MLYVDAPAWLLLLTMKTRSASLVARCRLPAVALAFAWVAAGCGGDSDFDKAARANTTVAWDDYLRAHPDGTHAHEARARLAALVEDGEWQRAHAADTADAYQRYLRGYPQGAHAHDALVAIANLNLAGTPATEAPIEAPPAGAKPAAGAIERPAPVPASAAPTPAPAAGAPPVAAAPVPPPRALAAPKKAPTPAPRAGASGEFRVQLGAFGSRAVAEHVWHDLGARYAELSARTPLITAGHAANGRTVERLQVGGFDRAAAEALCAKLATRKDPCLVVPPAAGAARPPG